jgi:hypothetical protein
LIANRQEQDACDVAHRARDGPDARGLRPKEQ